MDQVVGGEGEGDGVGDGEGGDDQRRIPEANADDQQSEEKEQVVVALEDVLDPEDEEGQPAAGDFRVKDAMPLRGVSVAMASSRPGVDSFASWR